MVSSPLKSCPFCGSGDLVKHVMGTGPDDLEQSQHYRCQSCGACGPNQKGTRYESHMAERWWNTRRSPEREAITLTEMEIGEAVERMLQKVYGKDVYGDPSPIRANMEDALTALLERFELRRRG